MAARRRRRRRLPTAQRRAIDRFIDALWIEDGLARNTLAAYRRDLTLYAQLAGGAARPRAATTAREADLLAYIAARHAGTRATTRQPAADGVQALLPLGAARAPGRAPTRRCGCRPPRQPLRVPKTLSEAQVEALLAAPDVDTPLGLRDRTMLELMYASGLRVSELVTLKTVHVGLAEGVLRVTGKGSKERLVPFGEEAHAWLRRYLAEARGRHPGGQAQRRAVRHRAAAAPMTRQMFWKLVKTPCAARPASPRRCRRTRCAMPSPPTC